MTDLEKKVIDFASKHPDFDKSAALTELKYLSEADSDLIANLWTLHISSQERGEIRIENKWNSHLAYFLKITLCKPTQEMRIVKRRTYGRSGFPDIDMDFDYLRRHEIVDYLVEKYGREYVGNIGNVQTLKTKAAVRRAIKVLDPTNSVHFDNEGKVIKSKINENFALENEILQTLPNLMKRGDGSFISSVDEACEEYPHFGQYMQKYPEVRRIASKLEGTIAGFGCHAAGIVISPIPLANIAPMHVTRKTGGTTEDGKPERVVATQFPMAEVERMGLIKFDILGLSTKTAINWACKYLAEKDIIVDWNKIPLDDKETLDLLHSGRTDGCFQLECVSGNTYVSAHYNIEDLYNSQINGKSNISPKSVDLANGCYRMSSISKVVKSDIKVPLYKVKVGSNNEIRVTQKHNFLTPNGWKQLSELKPNDRVLVDTQSHYSQSCQNCGNELRSRSRRSRASKLCKSCSAKTTCNPSCSEVKQMISNATKGRIPWNVGMKYATEYPSLLLSLRRFHHTRRGKSFEEQHGLEKALKLKEQLQKRMLGENNHMFGRKSPHAKGGFRKDLGHYVRSTWEADLARVYKYLDKDYLYEPKTFSVVVEGKLLNYTPDFYLVDEDKYVEVKGYMRELDRKKIDAFLEQYNENFSLIRKQEIAELELEYGELIDWECGSFPEKCSWQKIGSISYERDDYVYDICMQNEFKNYRANGFIVHNSPGMKECLKMIEIDSFNDLVVAIAMYRPGPKDYISEFAGRKRKRISISYPHELLKKITEKTFGIICYQEDTLISMADGSENPIKQVKMGDKVHSVNLDTGQVEIKECHGCEETKSGEGLLVSLENGYKLLVTPDHEILTYYGMREVQNLVAGKDIVACPLLTPSFGVVDSIAPWLGTDESIAYLLGQLTGDGNIHKGCSLSYGFKGACDSVEEWIKNQIPKLKIHKYFHGSWHLGISCDELQNSDSDWDNVDEFNSDLRGEIFQPKIIYGNRKTKFHVLLENTGLKTNCYFKSVPLQILRHKSDRVKNAYLAGLFDSDGSITKSTNGFAICHYTSQSPELINGVRKLLQLLGISHQVRANRVHVWDTEKLCQCIDEFLVVRSFPEKLTKGKYSSRVPCRELRAFKDKEHLSEREFYTKYGVSRSTQRTKNEFICYGTAEKCGITSGHLRYYHITSIEKIPEQKFWGMSVSGHHNLIANGIVSKNCYQEQVMQTFMALADLTASDGYAFMKGCAKKKPEIIQGYKVKFFAGARKQKIDQHTIQSIWDDLEKFAGYSFNLAHSVSYAYESFKTAYLKTHHPTEFIAARLSVETRRRNFDDVEKYKKDAAKYFGFTFEPVDINKSKLDWSIEGEKTLRIPLLAKGVGIKAAEDIVTHQPYTGKDLLLSFGRKTGRAVSTKVIEAMKDAGFWGGITKERLVANFDQIKKDKKKMRGRTTMDLYA